MILFSGDLVNLFGCQQPQILQLESQSKLYDEIVKARNDIHAKLVEDLISKKDSAKISHDLTKEFIDVLVKFDDTPKSKRVVRKCILKLNRSKGSKSCDRYHIFFCLDDSGSMYGQPWKDLMTAVIAFIDRRIAMCTNAGAAAEDVVTILNHASQTEVMCENEIITSHPETKTKFRSGGNDFKKCLEKCHELITKADCATYTPVLLFMSDGGCSNGEAEIQTLANTFPTLKIFMIGFGRGCDQKKLENMAKISRGQFFYGIDGAQLKSEFESISSQISKTYSL